MAKFIGDKQACIDHLNSQTIDWLYSLSKVFNNRSGKQNKYYWGVVIHLLTDFTWNMPDEMHEELKYLFLKDKSWERFRIKDTKNLNTKEFEDYCENIRIWAAMEFWVHIPEPNEEQLQNH